MRVGAVFKNAVGRMPLGRHLGQVCSGSESDLYLRLIDSCITQLKAHGPSRTCNESKEEEVGSGVGGDLGQKHVLPASGSEAHVALPLLTSRFRIWIRLS